MRVTLLAYTQMNPELDFFTSSEPEYVCALGKRLCNTDEPLKDVMSKNTYGKVIERIKSSIEQGHLGVLEHAVFTFVIEGISRNLTHQLVRHRTAAYLQQSQRAVNMRNAAIIVPPSIRQLPEESRSEFIAAVKDAKDIYMNLVELGMPREDARYIMPHGMTTRIMMTINCRNLIHLFKLRLAKSAQWEIRYLAEEMLMYVQEVCPTMFSEELKQYWE